MTDTSIKKDIYVIHDPEGKLIVNGENGADKIDEVEAYKLFRKDFGDNYDFATFIVDSLSGFPDVGHGSTPVYSDIQGTGLGPDLDAREPFGTNKLLRTSVHRLRHDIAPDLNIHSLMHEIGHTWGFYVGNTAPEESPLRLLHEDFPNHPEQKWGHWGRWPDNANSCMDYDGAEWIDLGNGEFKRKIRDITWDGDFYGFHSLDLYLMGLIPASDVPKISIVQNPEPPISNSYEGPYRANPEVKYVEVSEVIKHHGDRKPDYLNSQRVFHEAWILITKDLKTDEFFELLDQWRAVYSRAIRKATGGRLVIDTSLLREISQEDYRELYFRDNASSGDIYGKSSSNYWNSPDLWVRNNDEGNNPLPQHQKPIQGQSNWIYARVNNASGAPYRNVTVNVYLADRANKALGGEEFLYPVDWNPKNLIGSVDDIQATPAILAPPGITIVKIEWKADGVSKAFLYSEPSLLAEIIPMEVYPTGSHRAFDNRKLAQRNIILNSEPFQPSPESKLGELVKFDIGLKVLAWAWIIVIGVLLITPGGTLCISCGAPINIPGYIGDGLVTVLGIGSIALGAAGLASDLGVFSINGQTNKGRKMN